MTEHTQPLQDTLVLDFTTLAPGPLASLMLHQAGANVMKVERPGVGDEMRTYGEAFGDKGHTFAMLNAGKNSLVADLNNKSDLYTVKEFVRQADVLLEQFRPGVMAKFGLDYESVKKINPRLIYCAITGFGQTGPKAKVAAHDLNYVADTGMLSLGECPNGTPTIPPLLAADLAAGSYPAVMNILLALAKREKTGEGEFIDVSMTDNLFPLMFWALGLGWGAGRWPAYGNELLSGGSPRYQIYQTSDNRHLVVAALEQRFWVEFCNCIGLNSDDLNDQDDPTGVIKVVADVIRKKSGEEWKKVFDGKDACTMLVNTLEEAVADEHYNKRGVFDQWVLRVDDENHPGLPTPISPKFRASKPLAPMEPILGEVNKIIEDERKRNH